MIAPTFRQSPFIILADESANWRIAGLRQLERLILAINELAVATNQAANIDVVIVWDPDISPAVRWMPDRQRSPRVRLTESIAAVDGPARVLTTRLAVERGMLNEFLQATLAVRAAEEVAGSWRSLFQEFEGSCRNAPERGWHLLDGAGESEQCERTFLQHSGKSQDGIVSRLLNRPVSRLVTRLLLRYPITPTGWTLAISVLPLLAFVFLVQGDYLSIVTGAGLFQIFSILDGCDGEIARAKYLESKRGERIDYLCDLGGNVLFMVGLGVGLSRVPGPGASNYFLEGILGGAFMGLNEILLWRAPRPSTLASTAAPGKFYARHRGMIQYSGLTLFGEKFVGCLFQITKRDVSVLAFFFLALAGWPQWILHLWLAVIVGSTILAGIAFLRVRGGRDLPGTSGTRP